MCTPRRTNRKWLIVLLFPLSIQAAEWLADPSIEMRSGYDSNIRLTPGQHDAVWENVLSPSVAFGRTLTNTGVTGKARMSIRRFSGGSGLESSKLLDREDYHLDTNYYFNTPLSNFKANLDYTLDSTQDSELDQTGIVINTRTAREKLSLGPSWSKNITPLNRIDLSYQYNSVNFPDGNASTQLVNYDYHVASTALTHTLTQRLQAVASAGFSRYLPDSSLDSDTVSLQGGLTALISQTLTGSVQVGQRLTTTKVTSPSGICVGAIPGATFPSCNGGSPVQTGITNVNVDSVSPVYGLNITKSLLSGSLSAALTRSSLPGGNGELLDSTRLTMSGNYRNTETFNTSLTIEYTENSIIVNQNGIAPVQDKTKFYRITPAIGWHWRREWILSGQYRYTYNDDPQTSGTATSNSVYATLTYQPGKISVSR